MKKPENASKKIFLDSGRVVYFRSPKMKDQRQASSIASRGGDFKPLAYIEEMIKLLIVGVERKNGEAVDIKNKQALLDDVLTYDEAQQILANADSLGVALSKKKAKIQDL